MLKTPVSVSRITYDDLDVLKKEIRKIREMIELPLRHPELFKKVGITAPKCVFIIWITRNWKNISKSYSKFNTI